MHIQLQQSVINPNSPVIKITGSKSESNRLLLLQALYPEICIENLSNADDTKIMQAALNSADAELSVHHAGTAMRFLTAYFAIQNGKQITLTGSARMQQRPIQVLVAALQTLGANISYLNKKGYPPLQIKGSAILKSKISLPANISSQYISALLLIAPKLPLGLTINLLGNITSKPYINMTIALLQKLGIAVTFFNNQIVVEPKIRIKPIQITVESDWSAASYY